MAPRGGIDGIDGGGDGDVALDGGRLDGGGRGDGEAAVPLPEANCVNGLRDGLESDVDCGGAQCGACGVGERCDTGSDCQSGECEGGRCTCLSLSECPADACGTVEHCAGELECGDCDQGVCHRNRCCEPRECGADECGVVGDGCGGALRCGASDCCEPRDCAHPSLEGRCGEYEDRCGGTIECQCQGSVERCYLGECCEPLACEQTDRCGTVISDGCGGVTSCGCDEDEVCFGGTCCLPMPCQGFSGDGCMLQDDGCGGTLHCGCSGDDVCNEGLCCTPSACGAGGQGDLCGPQSDGCGGSIDCECEDGLSCVGLVCCSAQSCSDLAAEHRCGFIDDGCGSSVWCGCEQTHGMLVTQREDCGDTCAATAGEIAACSAGAAIESAVQVAGWDFSASLSSDLCDAAYGFSPPWSECHAGFQIEARGFIELTQGTHCFSIGGSGSSSCGALYLVQDPESFAGWDALSADTAAVTQSGQAPVCFTLDAGFYPIRWHFTLDGGLQSFQVNYCGSDTASCAPLSVDMLYPALL